jgi:hypothetical protein
MKKQKKTSCIFVYKYTNFVYDIYKVCIHIYKLYIYIYKHFIHIRICLKNRKEINRKKKPKGKPKKGKRKNWRAPPYARGHALPPGPLRAPRGVGGSFFRAGTIAVYKPTTNIF